MAFSEVAVSSIADVITQIALFANGQGWTTTVGGGGATLRRPLSTTGKDVDLTTDDFVTWALTPDLTAKKPSIGISGDKLLAGEGARVFMPRFTGPAAAPVVPLPTKLYCFGAGDPEPYLSFAIEFGFNLFRLIYIGTTDRIGGYKGGDCCSVTNMPASPFYALYPMRYPNLLKNLFRAAIDQITVDIPGEGDLRGGTAFYIGAGQDGPVSRKAQISRSSSPSNFRNSIDSSLVFGGWGDGPDDLLMSHGFADFAGDQLIFPINLFTPVGSGPSALFRPLGSVRGIRNVNMRNIEPGERITVGNKSYRVFPSIRKTNDPVVTSASTNAVRTWPDFDASYLFGVAMLEGDA